MAVIGGMSRSLSKLIVCALALGAPAAVRSEPAVVALARAYLGPQSTLDGMTSIHYVGTLDRLDPDNAAKGPIHTTLDLIFVKPLRQHLEARGTKASMTTVLDGYDAWDLLVDNADRSRFRLTWLPPSDIKTLRANTWENLYYYRVPPGGTVEDKGPATVDGIVCERVDFIHGPGIDYARYFDRDTGRLVLTERGPESFRESGEIKVEGVRFPKTIISKTKTASGKEVVSTAIFERIAINETLPPDLFAVPSIVVPKKATTPAAGK